MERVSFGFYGDNTEALKAFPCKHLGKQRKGKGTREEGTMSKRKMQAVIEWSTKEPGSDGMGWSFMG